MRSGPSIACMTLIFLCSTPTHALEDTPPSQAIDSQITSVGLFKNGLTIVRRTVMLPGEGTFEIRDVPAPVHGTFWIESEAVIETRVSSRLIETPLESHEAGSMREDLAGSRVTIHFQDGSIPPVRGIVVSQAPNETLRSNLWNASPQPYSGLYRGGPVTRNSAAGLSGHIVLDTDTGRVYVMPSLIAYLRVEDPVKTITRRQPILIMTARETGEKPIAVDISYLTWGMAWAPSYRLDITDNSPGNSPGNSPENSLLQLEQKAVIRNELEDLRDVEIELISGFPSVEFGHVSSPISPGTTWNSFFRQLSQRSTTGIGFRGSVLTQQRMVEGNNAYPDLGGVGNRGMDAPILPEGEGVDLYYRSIGRHTLAKGDSLMLTLADSETRGERIVEWIISDTRDVYGRPKQSDTEETPNDAVRFLNPFDYPMTTASIMIRFDGRFGGQHLSHWLNPGEETIVPITRALSIRARHLEEEEPDSRSDLTFWGQHFFQSTVRGEVRVGNRRSKPIKIIVRRRFSGSLIEADGEPRDTLLEDGIYSRNARHELTWTIAIPPGEERILEYRYTVIIRR